MPPPANRLRAGTAAGKALEAETAELRGKLTLEMKKFAAAAAAAVSAIETECADLRGELALEMKKFSAIRAEFDESLREFKRKREENFSKVLSEQAAESEFLSREAREKMESVSAEFLNRIAEMKAWLERTAGELDKAREATTAAQAKLLAAAAGEKEVPAPDGQLGERLLELERRISKEMLDRKLGAVTWPLSPRCCLFFHFWQDDPDARNSRKKVLFL
ncbi:MAG: hypothetical protein HY796_01560 [Elusimicrobia bacterium]|nr:hypothetical protein [Elusimicrobiota bacterium]